MLEARRAAMETANLVEEVEAIRADLGRER